MSHFVNNYGHMNQFCYETRGLVDDLVRKSSLTFRENLQRLMDNAELDQSGLAAKIQMTPGAINRWLKGTRRPSFDDLDALSRVFDVPVTEFFSDPTDTRPNAGGMEVEKALRTVEAYVKDAVVEEKARSVAKKT